MSLSTVHWAQVSPLADLLVRAANMHPERTAFVMPDVRLSYDELLSEANRIAKGIVALGIAPRSHIGILANNGVPLVASIFGVALADCVAVPLNARHKELELGYIVEDADLRLILTSAEDTSHVDFRRNLQDALPGLAQQTSATSLSLECAPLLQSIVVLAGEATSGFMGRETFDALAGSVDVAEVEKRRLRTKVRDIALLIYTSGTTANPKGCLLTHEAITRGPVERASRRFKSRDHDVTWAGGPLFHIGSLAPFIGSIGTCGTYLSDVVFEPERALDLMEREGVTAAWPWFPAILQPLLDHPSFDPRRFPRLKKVLLIGPETLILRAQQSFPEVEFIQACGMTETAGIFALCAEDETLEQRATSNGKPAPGMEVRIVDLDNGRDVAFGEVGEILVRGYCVMEGYYKAPEKTAETLDQDGWLHTGDLYSQQPDGRLSFNGRAKDMLKVGGENVAAIEIESFLCSHPAVKIAEVIGKSDPRLDEVPVAFVEMRPGRSATESELIEFCKGKIASFKIPRAIHFMDADAWPMSATKVNKRELRKLIE